MANQKNGIEWTDETWNPMRGCSPHMPCAPRCWAQSFAHRQAGLPGYGGFTDARARWTGRVELIREHLDDPLHWRRPRRVAVGLMGDMYRLSFDELDEIYNRMERASWHTFQTLTKVPKQRLLYLTRRRPPLKNVHEGLSCMTQRDFDRDVETLLRTPAAVRWLSLEPLLGPVRLTLKSKPSDMDYWWHDPLHGSFMCDGMNEPRSAPALDWIVVGGESGPGARPMHPDWVRSIRDQCVEAGVPFMLKQWGDWLHEETETGRKLRVGGCRVHVWPDGSKSYLVGKHDAGRRLDGREWLELPGAAG